MHKSSLSNLKRFADKYLSAETPIRILDIGSQEVEGETEGSYRSLFQQPNWHYEGADIVPGKNVSIVLKHPYRWKEIKNKTYDCIICGQMLEHDEYFWLTMLEIQRVLKPGGLCCIVAPSGGMEHRYPVDCYRFYPDGLSAAAKYSGLDVIEVYAQWNPELYPEMDMMWRDCVLICRRPEIGFFREIYMSAARRLIQIGSYPACHVHYSNDYPDNTTWTFPQPPVFSTIYYNRCSGFNEQDTIRFGIRSGQSFSETFVIPDGTTDIRFDPVEGFHCVLEDLSISVGGKQIHYHCVNGEHITSGILAFLNTTDPQLLLDTIEERDKGIGELSIQGKVYVII